MMDSACIGVNDDTVRIGPVAATSLYFTVPEISTQEGHAVRSNQYDKRPGALRYRPFHVPSPHI